MTPNEPQPRDPRPVPGSRHYLRELDLDAPPAAVWEALATPAGLTSWFPTAATVEPRVGGRVDWSWGDRHTWAQRVVVFEPGQRLCTRYGRLLDGQYTSHAGEPDADGPLFVDFQLQGRGGGTRLRVVHFGFGPGAEFDREFEGISGGWPVELESLRLYLERHRGQTRQCALVPWPIADDATRAWGRLLTTQGLGRGEGLDALAPGTPFALDGGPDLRFHGTTLLTRPRQFAGRAASHGDGFLRLSVDGAGTNSMAWLWLETWGRSAAEVQAVAAAWRSRLTALYPPAATPTLQGARRGETR
jgi:uncharacterized protein YndB with AHSA1/START domain